MPTIEARILRYETMVRIISALAAYPVATVVQFAELLERHLPNGAKPQTPVVLPLMPAVKPSSSEQRRPA